MRRLLLILIPLTLVLAACSPKQPEPPIAAAVPTVTAPAGPATALPAPTLVAPDAGLMRVDEQGMVVLEVTPANLGSAADTLEFDVAMNTHSVDLSMDLAALSTLSTDTGRTVQPLRWDAPPGGGHHVSGKLIFPSVVDGKYLLEGASKLTLTILNVDAPSRLFEWDLN